MIPRPISQYQIRFTALAAKGELLDVISQSANTARGSLSGASSTVAPSGSFAFVTAGLAWSNPLNKTSSSFHSPVVLKAICEKNAAMSFSFSGGQFSVLSPMNVCATAFAMAFGSLASRRAVEIYFRVPKITSAGSQERPRKLRIRRVIADAVPDPAVISHGRLGPEIHGKLRFHPEQIAPFHPPIIRKLGTLQQRVDQRRSFILDPCPPGTGPFLPPLAACQ